MNRSTLWCALLGLALVQSANASDFSGAYVGLNVGHDSYAGTALPKNSQNFVGAKAGYNWDWNSFLVGAEIFADNHTSSYTGRSVGLDARLGLPMDRWLPYVKLGLTGSSISDRPYGGIGLEYSLNQAWSVGAEWSGDSKNSTGNSLTNSKFSIGLNYHFGGTPAIAPTVVAPAPAPAPVMVTPAPTPVAEVSAPVYKTEVTERKIVLEGTSFDTNSAKLKKSATAELNKAVKFAEEYKDSDLVLIGYTDSRGNAEKNLKLSEARAESVKAYLVSHGVAAQRLSTQGKGAADPVADNKTEAGRAKNRRVEIKSTLKTASKVQVQ